MRQTLFLKKENSAVSALSSFEGIQFCLVTVTWYHLQSSEVSSQEEFAVQEEKVRKEQLSEHACVSVCVSYPVSCPSLVLHMELEPPVRITVDTKLLLPGKGFSLLKLRGIFPWISAKENLSPGRFFLLFEIRMQEQGFSYLVLKVAHRTRVCHLEGEVKTHCLCEILPKRFCPHQTSLARVCFSWMSVISASDLWIVSLGSHLF